MLENPYRTTVIFPDEETWDAICRQARLAKRRPAEWIADVAISRLANAAADEAVPVAA